MRNRSAPRAAAAPAFGLLLLSACAAILPDGPPRETDAVPFSQESALVSVNAFRARNGLAPLKTASRLVAAAEAQSRAMAAKNDMDHAVDGPLPGRIRRFGYPFATASENIAMGQASFDAAMAGWERSAGHRRNLLDPTVTEAGFAAARERASGRIYWTQIFGRQREGAAADALAGADGAPVMTIGGFRVPSR